MCDGIFLMWLQGDLRVHSGKFQMISVILSWTDGVESFIIDRDQHFPPFPVFEYPVLKFFFDHILLLSCQYRFFFI